VGPIALFDKSFLQSISTDESVWFDQFFMPIVCPIFYVETLGNLAKEATERGPPEVIVRDIANKFPEWAGSPCCFHADLVINDLLGYHVQLRHQQFFHIPQQLHAPIVQAWQHSGKRTLAEFAPYAAYALTVEIFLQVALGAGLIGVERPSNRADIAYLFYLPFSMVFVSSDRLHRSCAPLFMRPDQEFVWGLDLKPALKAVNDHFLRFPEAEREKGISAFAHYPPTGNQVADLWDRFMRKGYRDEEPIKLDPEKEAELVRRLTAGI
jgi:hypothetical protein